MDKIQSAKPDLTLFYKFPPDNKDDYAIDVSSRNFVTPTRKKNETKMN